MSEIKYVKRFAVNFIESEAGWGSKVESTTYFATLVEAKKCVANFNSKNDKKVTPDWYMYAEDPREVFIEESKLKEQS